MKKTKGMATIIKLEVPKNPVLTEKQKVFLEKLRNGPTMTEEQVKEYEKNYPWLKKTKD